MDAVLYDLVSKKNFVCEEFLMNDSFISKSDVVFLEGCAGGGGGHATGTGGAGGAGCDFLPVPVTKGSTYTITVGAGGAIGGAGGTTSFGSLVSLPGGAAGIAVDAGLSQGGLKKSLVAYTSGTTQVNADTIGSIITGASVLSYNSGSGSIFNVGNSRFKGNSGAGGMFGEGGTSGNAAAANSGAGGGTNAAGGSGRMRVYYFK